MAGLPKAPTESQPDCGDVFQWLELASIHHADKLAVVDRGRDATSTYSQLHRESVALAHWLHKQGIVRGDAIAVHCRNSAAVMRIHFAAAALHAVVVNLNINLASRELKYILDDSRSKLVFVDQGVGTSLVEASEDLPLVFIDVDGSCSVPQAILAKGTPFDGLLSETGPLPVVDGASMEDVFHLYYTSGTTGKPKPVELRYDERALFAWLRRRCSWHQRCRRR